MGKNDNGQLAEIITQLAQIVGVSGIDYTPKFDTLISNTDDIEAKQDAANAILGDLLTAAQAQGITLTDILTELQAQGVSLGDIFTELEGQGIDIADILTELEAQSITLASQLTELQRLPLNTGNFGPLQSVSVGDSTANPTGKIIVPANPNRKAVIIMNGNTGSQAPIWLAFNAIPITEVTIPLPKNLAVTFDSTMNSTQEIRGMAKGGKTSLIYYQEMV